MYLFQILLYPVLQTNVKNPYYYYKLLPSLKTRLYQGTKILDLRKYTQHDHMPNRWTVSGRMVGPVSV